MTNRPLVTLAIVTYQQERYVAEAIAGAFAQTYSPLQIVISDDASTDRTFAIIEEAVRAYEGPHQIVTNRNERNLGIGAHVNKVWLELAEGDWIAVSAGDDVSLPGRVARLMEVARPELGAIHHSCTPIDAESRELPYLPKYAPNLALFARNSVEELIRHHQWLKGATMCLNRRMLERYGPINRDVVHEDNVLAYRAQAFGGIVWLDEPLMRYRIHATSVTQQLAADTPGHYVKRIVRHAKDRLALNQQVRDDSRKIAISAELLAELDQDDLACRIDLCCFGEGPFEPAFLRERRFFAQVARRVLHRPYRALRRAHRRR